MPRLGVGGTNRAVLRNPTLETAMSSSRLQIQPRIVEMTSLSTEENRDSICLNLTKSRSPPAELEMFEMAPPFA